MTGFTCATVVSAGDMMCAIASALVGGRGLKVTGKEPCVMAKRIYVGGLPYSATNADLENLFASSGTVTSATIVTDRYTGQAKGFGFVEMETDSQADAAIASLNGTMMGG